jgi:hypothetical protein
MTKSEKPSEFGAYLRELLNRSQTSLSDIEKMETEAALDRCRELAHEVQSALKKKPDHLVDVESLADFQVSLERAISLLVEQKNGHKGGKDES